MARNLDKNVSPNWEPVAGLNDRKAGMPLSDRIWWWLRCLGGLALIAVGVVLIAYVHLGKWGGIAIAAGFVFFAIGPSQAARNGYRDD